MEAPCGTCWTGPRSGATIWNAQVPENWRIQTRPVRAVDWEADGDRRNGQAGSRQRDEGGREGPRRRAADGALRAAEGGKRRRRRRGRGAPARAQAPERV